MELPFFQVDAFSSTPFSGNPAAVVLLEDWLDDRVLQSIAAENNLSETAFVRPNGDGSFGLRWCTPTVEVDLCGHATLAAGYTLLCRDPELAEVAFDTRSGRLVVRREGDEVTMALPVIPPRSTEVPDDVATALRSAPSEVFEIRAVHHARYFLALYDSVEAIDALAPDIRALGAANANVVCTAPGRDDDFVSRFFAPASGVDEDPVTGSAHCTLAPFWTERLGRNPVRGHQRSRRGGKVHCTVDGNRVWLRGDCATVITGALHLDG